MASIGQDTIFRVKLHGFEEDERLFRVSKVTIDPEEPSHVNLTLEPVYDPPAELSANVQDCGDVALVVSANRSLGTIDVFNASLDKWSNEPVVQHQPIWMPINDDLVMIPPEMPIVWPRIQPMFPGNRWGSKPWEVGIGVCPECDTYHP